MYSLYSILQRAERELSSRCLHVLRRFFWPRRRPVQRLRCRKIQDEQRQRGVHRLFAWNVLDEHTRDAGGDLRHLCSEFLFAERELCDCCLQMQRRRHRPRRQSVLHRLRHWQVQDDER